MCPRTSCPLSSLTLNIVFGRASAISPSISIFSSLGTGRFASDEADIHRLRSLVAGLLLVLHLRVLGERLEASAVDPGVVDKEVSISIIRSDEAVALLVVEPLDGSGRHVPYPFLRVTVTCEPDEPAVTERRHGRPNSRDATSPAALERPARARPRRAGAAGRAGAADRRRNGGSRGCGCGRPSATPPARSGSAG